MKEFKIGDKVIVKKKFWKIKSNIYALDGMRKLAGRTLEVVFVNSNGDVRTKQDDSNDNTSWYWDKNWVELYTEPSKEITWETLKWKDVLVDYDGRERMVLGVLNDLVDVSCTDNFKMAYANFHKQELQNDGYTIKQATPTPETPITIEIGGIKYNKDEVENALKDLKAQG